MNQQPAHGDVAPTLPKHPHPAADARPRRGRRRLLRWLAAAAAVAVPVTLVAVPHARSVRYNANESAAIATLKNISSAQSQLQASGAIDCDGDGRGEFGFLGEMSGSVPMRAPIGAARELLTPAVLTKRFGDLRAGRTVIGGYVFQVFLPALGGGWVGERDGGEPVPIDVAQAEQRWLAYAWPLVPDVSGRRAFVITWSGDLLACNMATESYGGERAPPAGQAAFNWCVDEWLSAPNTVDSRGNTWVVV